MRNNTWAGLGLLVSVSLLGCGSSSDVNSGQRGLVDGSAASSGSSGMSGNSGTSGNANAGGNGQSGNVNAGGTGQSGNANAGGTGQSGNANAGGTGQSGNANAGGTGQSGNPNAGGTGQAGNSNAGGTGQAGGGPIVDGGGVTWGDTQCTDGIDNDGDGKADGDDPECTGPLDNDEATFATGIPGDNRDPKWQDCFFDGNSGAGDDGCRYNTGCLTGDLPQTSPSCTLTQQCKDYCQRYTPNGCDCFGCCKVPLPGGGTASIQITATCTLADAADPQKCPPCVVSDQCGNTCGRCELCIGKDTIPADCTPPPGTGGAPNTGGAANGGSPGAGGATTGGRTGGGGTSGSPGAGGSPGTGGTPFCPTPACAPGQQPCGVSCLPDCPSTDFCLTGCCIHAPA